MGGNSSKDMDPNEIGANAPPDQMIKAAKDHPFRKGHAILRDFADALEREYVFRQGPAVGEFEECLSDDRVECEGVGIKDFKEWFCWVEACAPTAPPHHPICCGAALNESRVWPAHRLIRESYFEGRNIATVDHLRQWWGISSAGNYGQVTPPPGYPEAAGYPGAVPVATAVPVAASAYPSQQGVPVASAQPAVAVATPVKY